MSKYQLEYIYLLLITIVLSGCGLTKTHKLLNQGKFDSINFNEEINFRYVKNLILVDIQIENKVYTCVLDTGAEISLFDSEGLKNITHSIITNKNVTGAAGVKNKFSWIEIPKVNIGDLEYNNLTAISSDFSSIIDLFKCDETIHGVIGSNFMRKAKWRIDYQKQKIWICNELSLFEKLPNELKIDLECGKVGEADIKVSLNGIEGNYTFDTGAGITIQSNSKTFQKLLEENGELDYTQSNGATGLTLNGMQFGETKFTLIEEVKFGEVVLNNKIIELEGNSSSLLGNGIWENYILTIDWDACNLYLCANEKIKSDSLFRFQFDISINDLNNGFILRDEWMQHSGDLSVGKNNKITHIEGVNVFNMNSGEYCDFLNNKLPRIKEQEKIVIILQNDEGTEEITLFKEQLLPK